MGLTAGLQTTWRLSKIIFPITLLITILQHTPVIGAAVWLFTPLMGVFGLPGDAALVLVLGNLLNPYAAIGAMLTMELTVKEVFILSVMLSFSHNLILETAIASKIGVKAWVMISVRLGLALISALLIHWIWQGGSEIAQYALVPQEKEVVSGWLAIIWQGLLTSMLGIVSLALIVIPLMVGIQLLKDINILPYLAKSLSPVTRMIGVSQKTGVTLMAGLVFGIAYGAGVIIQAAKEDQLSKKDIYLVSIFLVACHAVIEDTLLFIPLGINVLPLLLLRVFMALLITTITAKIWGYMEKKEEEIAASS
jgi:hypothetical protein